MIEPNILCEEEKAGICTRIRSGIDGVRLRQSRRQKIKSVCAPWTTEPPTKAGYYWWQTELFDRRIRYVIGTPAGFEANDGLAGIYSTEELKPVGIIGGCWLGPLQPPPVAVSIEEAPDAGSDELLVGL